ncbi:MAG TPA: hypothetical protein VFU76_00050 [Terriglobales bacterium]|nr:hypothetical protein [Terriglobales bacterium]
MKTLLAAAAFVLIFVLPGSSADTCNCPKDDPSTHGRVDVLIDKELSTAEPIPTSKSLGYPKSLTICMAFDQTNKGYPTDVKLVAEGSLDGRIWFPLTVAGTDRQAATIDGCLQVTPTRYVRAGWPPAANITSPGPRVTIQVQASY